MKIRALFSECSLVHAARTGRRPPSAQQDTGPLPESHHFRLGWASNATYPEMCRITLRLLDPASFLQTIMRLSDLTR